MFHRLECIEKWRYRKQNRLKHLDGFTFTHTRAHTDEREDSETKIIDAKAHQTQ